MVAGKFGLRTINTLLYSYSADEDQVVFQCLEGDVMPILNGRYVFRDVTVTRDLAGDTSRLVPAKPVTEVTYELEIGFAMGIPAWTHSALVGIILNTALVSFKSHIERSGSGKGVGSKG